MKSFFTGFSLDTVGFSASFLCAIHCSVLPLLLAATPVAGLGFLNESWVEYTVIGLSVLIAAWALRHGYRQHHRWLAGGVALAGFGLILVAHLVRPEWLEITLTTAGATTVAIAHIVNWKLLRQTCPARQPSDAVPA